MNNEIETIKSNTLRLLEHYKGLEDKELEKMEKMERKKKRDTQDPFSYYFFEVEKEGDLNEFEENVSNMKIAFKICSSASTRDDYTFNYILFNIAHAIYSDSFELLTVPNKYIDFEKYSGLFQDVANLKDCKEFYSRNYHMYCDILGYNVKFAKKEKMKQRIQNAEEIITVDSLIHRLTDSGIPEFK